MRKNLYLVAAIAGTVIPYYFFISFLVQYGLDWSLIWQQLFVSDLAAFFVFDVVISTLTLWVFVFAEGRRLQMSHLWVYVIANLTVGVSLALPLFLYFRENHMGEIREG
jgi:hypothetical protein